MDEIVIVGAVRTPVGKRSGWLRDIHPVRLGAHVLVEALRRSGLEGGQVDHVLIGCVSQVGEQTFNLARSVVLDAGLPTEVPATTLDFQCGSSQQAVHLAAALIASGKVQAVITGADRIATNGDSANKIGTYGLAVVAARHRVPFYIAAPRTTIDPGCGSGAGIPIEFRPEEEVAGFGGQRWSPEGIGAYNPAFDVTPAELISAIITERGVARPPYERSLAELLAQP